MKKLLAVVLCVVLAAFALTACGQDNEPTATPPPAESPAGEESPAPTEGAAGLVGILVPAAPTGWVAAVQYYAKLEADELGLNYKIAASANPNEQANQVDEFISLGCEIIVLFPHNDELAVAAQKIMDEGITLINYDRTVNPTEPDYYVAGDNYDMGVKGAEYIAEKLENEGKVVIVGIPNYGDAVNGQRIQGFKDTIAEIAPDINILGEYASENGAPESGLAIMTDVLTANQHIDGVFSIDDELSIGLLQAINEANRDDIKVMTGGGGAQAYFKLMPINEDIWLASALYVPGMIRECVKMADGLIKGETYPQETIIPSQIIDRENVEEYVNENVDLGAPY